MFSIPFRKFCDEKKENNLLSLIIKMQFSFARAIITSTACAGLVFLSSYRNTIWNQALRIFSLGHFHMSCGVWWSVNFKFIAAPAPVSSRNGQSSLDREDTKPRHSHTSRSSSGGRELENRLSLGEGAVVQLPPKEPREGGRLECDRIIMADGTAINLFDENDDKGVREKAHKRSRERQDEVGLLAIISYCQHAKKVMSSGPEQ